MVMTFDIFFIGCLIGAIARDVRSSEISSDLLALLTPHSPNVTDRQRHLIKAADDDYVVTNTVGLVNLYPGYPTEEHNFTTEDGYTVSIFRIRGSPNSPPAEGKPAVYMQHAFLGSSDSWVLIGSGYDLAFLLADNGYDVWLGNIRGNTYGRSHINLTTDDKEFWDYSVDELATLDLPAAIDTVLKVSGQTDLFYIGHSLGTTMSYVILSELPEYNKKIRLAISLAPIAFWNQEKISVVFRIFCSFLEPMRLLFNFLEIYELFPEGSITFAVRFCNDGSAGQFICMFLWYAVYGKDPDDFNWNLTPYIGFYNPAGISTKALYFYEQNVNAGVLQKYDYGQTDNMKIYGTRVPPLYDLSNVTAPFALFYGEGDALSKKKNIEYLAGMLCNVVTIEKVPYRFFNHLDFSWATDANHLLYDRVIQIMAMFSNTWKNTTTPAT